MRKGQLLSLSAVALCLVTGACSRPSYSDSSGLVIVPGVGISNVVALGMTRTEIQRTTRDLVIQRLPKVRMPWVDVSPEGLSRLPWQKPERYWARVPSLGAVFDGAWGEVSVGSYIKFRVSAQTNATERDAKRFCGTLSCGLSFADGKNVTREDVTRFFGEPTEYLQTTVTDGTPPHMGSCMKSGTSFSLKASKSNIEFLYYPAQGIQFLVEEDFVARVAVFPAARRASPRNSK